MSCPHGLLSTPATCSQCRGAVARIVRFDEQLGVMTIDGVPEERGVDGDTAQRLAKFGKNKKQVTARPRR